MNAMASRNWVSREQDPTHGRIVLLQLTDEGRAVLRECELAVKTIEKQMMEGIELDAAGALQIQLETFVRNLRA
jgi:DNA-binding MarR family transcriptional regulator